MVFCIRIDSSTLGCAAIICHSVSATKRQRLKIDSVATSDKDTRSQRARICRAVRHRYVTACPTIYGSAGGHIGRRQQSNVAMYLVQKTISQQPNDHRKTNGLKTQKITNRIKHSGTTQRHIIDISNDYQFFEKNNRITVNNSKFKGHSQMQQKSNKLDLHPPR